MEWKYEFKGQNNKRCKIPKCQRTKKSLNYFFEL